MNQLVSATMVMAMARTTVERSVVTIRGGVGVGDVAGATGVRTSILLSGIVWETPHPSIAGPL